MDTFFFWLSKLAWLLIAPDSLLLILILSSFVLLCLGKHRIARTLLGASCIALVLIAVFPLHNLLLYPLERRFETNPALPAQIDGIIVLSGAEEPFLSSLWNQVELNPAAERNLAFLALARQYPKARLVFTGGTGSLSRQEYKAADVARTLFEQQGLDLNRVTFESESRNTFENALFTRKMVQPKKGEKWLLITTAWHMPRAVGAFCKQQWAVIAYPVDHATEPGHLFSVHLSLAEHLRGLNISIREWVGLFAYYLTDKTTALLPAECS